MKRKVFIVGGGPSLIGFDFMKLKDHDTICINVSVFNTPDPNFFITKDYTFFEKLRINNSKTHPRNLKNRDRFNNLTATKFFVACYAGNQVKDVNGRIVDTRLDLVYDLDVVDVILKSRQMFGLGGKFNDFRCGGDSGYSALQLAIILGYTEIYLLGLDFCTEGDFTHYHQQYKRTVSKEVYDVKLDSWSCSWIKSLDQLESWFPNVRVYSCSSISKLNSTIPHVSIAGAGLSS
jgi:hypothetical protein